MSASDWLDRKSGKYLCPVCGWDDATEIHGSTLLCDHRYVSDETGREIAKCSAISDISQPARICEKVRCYVPVREGEKPDKGSLYKHEDKLWKYIGTVSGCKRKYVGRYCPSCRSFEPEPYDGPIAGIRRGIREES